MDFLNRLLHRTGGGGGSHSSSPKSLQPKASESHNQNKSEAHFTSKDDHDVKSPPRGDTSAKLSDPKTTRHEHDRTTHGVPENVHFHKSDHKGEDEDKFEDAEENKSNLTVLAEDLGRLHLSTPGKMTITSSHEFAHTRGYEVNSSDLDDGDYWNDCTYDGSDVSLNSTVTSSNHGNPPVYLRPLTPSNNKSMSTSFEFDNNTESPKEVLSLISGATVSQLTSLTSENPEIARITTGNEASTPKCVKSVVSTEISVEFDSPNKIEISKFSEQNLEIVGEQSLSEKITFTESIKPEVELNLSVASLSGKEQSKDCVVDYLPPEENLDASHSFETSDPSLSSSDKPVEATESSLLVESTIFNNEIQPSVSTHKENHTETHANNSCTLFNEPFLISALDKLDVVGTNVNKTLNDSEIKSTKQINTEQKGDLKSVEEKVIEMSGSDSSAVEVLHLTENATNRFAVNIEPQVHSEPITNILSGEVTSLTQCSNLLSLSSKTDFEINLIQSTEMSKLTDDFEGISCEQSLICENIDEIKSSESPLAQKQIKDAYLPSELNQDNESDDKTMNSVVVINDVLDPEKSKVTNSLLKNINSPFTDGVSVSSLNGEIKSEAKINVTEPNKDAELESASSEKESSSSLLHDFIDDEGKKGRNLIFGTDQSEIISSSESPSKATEDKHSSKQNSNKDDSNKTHGSIISIDIDMNSTESSVAINSLSSSENTTRSDKTVVLTLLSQEEEEFEDKENCKEIIPPSLCKGNEIIDQKISSHAIECELESSQSTAEKMLELIKDTNLVGELNKGKEDGQTNHHVILSDIDFNASESEVAMNSFSTAISTTSPDKIVLLTAVNQEEERECEAKENYSESTINKEVMSLSLCEIKVDETNINQKLNCHSVESEIIELSHSNLEKIQEPTKDSNVVGELNRDNEYNKTNDICLATAESDVAAKSLPLVINNIFTDKIQLPMSNTKEENYTIEGHCINTTVADELKPPSPCELNFDEINVDQAAMFGVLETQKHNEQNEESHNNSTIKPIIQETAAETSDMSNCYQEVPYEESKVNDNKDIIEPEVELDHSVYTKVTIGDIADLCVEEKIGENVNIKPKENNVSELQITPTNSHTVGDECEHSNSERNALNLVEQMLPSLQENCESLHLEKRIENELKNIYSSTLPTMITGKTVEVNCLKSANFSSEPEPSINGLNPLSEDLHNNKQLEDIDESVSTNDKIELLEASSATHGSEMCADTTITIMGANVCAERQLETPPQASVLSDKTRELDNPEQYVNIETEIVQQKLSDSLYCDSTSSDSVVATQLFHNCVDGNLVKDCDKAQETKLLLLSNKLSLEEMENKIYNEFAQTNLKVDQILSNCERTESTASAVVSSLSASRDPPHEDSYACNKNMSSKPEASVVGSAEVVRTVKTEQGINSNSLGKVHIKSSKSQSLKAKTISDKHKESPKRNLMKDFKTTCAKNKPNLKENTFCEFFVAGDNKDEATDIVDFDNRLAVEAANVSEHIFNLSQELQDSDSDGDNNKTIITVGEGRNEIENEPSSNLISKQSQFYRSPQPREACDAPESDPFFGHNSLSIDSYMQSMRSVHPAHLNQSEAGPITADELNTQDLEFQDGANLDLDYFTRVGNAEAVVRNSLTRDSLYVKFDPIVGAIVSKTVSDNFAMPPPSLPEEETKKSCEEQPKSKEVGQGEAPMTPGRSPALEAVQKLISLTPPSASAASTNSSPAKSDRASVGTPSTTPLSTPKSAYIPQEKLQAELTKLEEIMKSRELYFESEINKRDLELGKRVNLDKRLADLEAELKVASDRELRLKKELQERTKSKQQLSLVMEEYEKTISQLVAQKEEEKKEFESQKDLLMKERDTAMQHLNNMEIAFNDVHQKYERSKTVIEGMKANEDVLKRSLAEYDDAVKSSNARYDSLKNHAIRQLETANQELDVIRRSHQAELAKLKAMLKKAEVRVTSLEESLEQKSKENQELAAICDELINKVGSAGN